jgi:glycosyltransferase involved in cell wall biosynthesis
VSAQRALKLVIVSQYFKPESALIPTALAHGLAARGHEVRVITGYPNYPEGRLYPGFRQKFVHHETDGAVSVRRVPIVVSHSQNALMRFANYVSFAVSSLTAGRFVRGADVVYVYATQMTAAFGPSIWRVPYVLHVQDLWPESVTGSAMVRNGLAKRVINGLLTAWLSLVYRRSSAVIAIAPTMMATLSARGVAKQKLHTVLNWADEDAVVPSKPVGAGVDVIDSLARDSVDNPRLSVVYAGNLGHFQDLETVIRAASAVTDLQGFTLTLVGAGVAESALRRLATDLNATNVIFRARVERDAMAGIYAASDFQMVPLADLPIFRGTIPSKFQGSLVNAIPVITTVGGDVGTMVREHNLGFVSPPGDAEALAAIFRAAYAVPPHARRTMGQNARQFYTTQMSQQSGIERIEGILADVANSSKEKERQ